MKLIISYGEFHISLKIPLKIPSNFKQQASNIGVWQLRNPRKNHKKLLIYSSEDLLAFFFFLFNLPTLSRQPNKVLRKMKNQMGCKSNIISTAKDFDNVLKGFRECRACMFGHKIKYCFNSKQRTSKMGFLDW